MGWSRHHRVGLIHFSPRRSYRGYTLFCNSFSGYDAYLIDMQGRICHRWRSEEGISYAYLLPSGNLLLRTHPPRDAGAATGLPGGAAALLELDWDSNVVWEYRNPMLHLDFERLPNGNTLALQWEALPPDMISRIQGGFAAEEGNEKMFSDLVQEVSAEGKVVNEWRLWEYLDPEEDIICPLEARREWTHCNALNVTSEGDLLVSFRHINTVGIVDRTSGGFRWKWGPGEISHQHHPTDLGSGRVMLFDNGSHMLARGVTYSRVIEVDTGSGKVAWEYLGDPPFSFYSPLISSAERQPNGNTLICEGSAGRFFEVTPDKEIVWEYINPFFTKNARAAGGGPEDYSNTVFRAHRYSPDHPAFRGRDLDPARFSALNQVYASE